MDEMTYTDKDGNNVFTSKYLKNRGSCCKTNCLHCPYGFTLKNNPIEFKEVGEADIDLVNSFIKHDEQEETSVAASLLGSAFGSSKGPKKVTRATIGNYNFALLKGHICGVIKKGSFQPSELHLAKEFKDQGIDLDLIKSLY
jgi:hypothetical protein